MGEMTLFEWAVSYIKYKDSVRGKIQEISEDISRSRIHIKNKDGSKEEYLCTDILEGINTNSLSSEKVVCLNRKENVNWLTSNWDSLKDKKCVFLFVNPKRSENWAINPGMHHSITDKSALKPGLKALFESVPEA